MQIGSDVIWDRPPAKLTLAWNEVHLWRATIDVPSSYLPRIWKILSSDERDRAERFIFERDRLRFLVARGFLRVILSRYLDCAPNDLRLDYGEYGKPSLGTPFSQTNLTFNLAHSAGLGLYGVTQGRAVGVDLEQIRSEIDIEEIASRMFSTTEAGELRSVPTDARLSAFFNCWTRKEAFLKAKGAGLSLPLHQFDVTLFPGDPASLVETKWDKYEAPRWSLRAIDVGTGYVAAVAVEGHNWRLNHWQANGDMFA